MDDTDITPTTDLETLPRLERDIEVGISKVYLKDSITGDELDSPLNGSSWCYSGGMSKDKNGQYVRGTVRCLEVVVWTKSGPRRGFITPETFPGQTIQVSVWHGPQHPCNKVNILTLDCT